jgi:hypothetical protein
VGQQQVNTYLWNCWSRAAITVSAPAGAKGSSSQQGAGGIAGFNSSQETGGGKRQGKALAGCVALNPSVSAPEGFERVGRVIGDSAGDVENCYAWSAMPVTTGGSPAEPFVLENAEGVATRWSIDGADCAEKPEQSFYQGLDWDFGAVWKMGGDGYPALQWQ